MKDRSKKKPTVMGTVSNSTPPPAMEEVAPTSTVEVEAAHEADAPSGFVGSYNEFEAEARGLADSAVPVFSGNARVAYRNVRKGVVAVVAERIRIESNPGAPKVDFARIEAVVRIGEALMHADGSVLVDGAPPVDVNEMASKVFEIRDVLLSNAVSLVKSGVIKGDDAKIVAEIQKGTGTRDAAQDCIDLATLFRRIMASIKGLSPVTIEHVTAAEKAGSDLLAALKAKGVSGVPANSMRNRMAALLAREYGYVASVGGWLWGHDVAAHVPLLRSRSLPTAAAPATPVATAPVTPVTPATHP